MYYDMNYEHEGNSTRILTEIILHKHYLKRFTENQMPKQNKK